MSYGRTQGTGHRGDGPKVSKPMTDLGERSDHTDPQPAGAADDASVRAVAPAVVELDMPSRTDLVAVARMVVAAAAGCRSALAGDRLDDLRLLTSEATTNAIEANLATEQPGRVSVGAELSEAGLTLTVVDQGRGLTEFPEALSAWTELPDLQDPDQRRREGGFGLPLMHLLSSRPVVFLSGERGTIVRLHMAQERPAPV